MFQPDRISKLLAKRLCGYSLPQEFYTSPEVFEFDLQAIFQRNWAMVGFEAELPTQGSYIATSIGRTPIVVIRNSQGALAGFHNSCRHRGAQIVQEGVGRTPRLMCPYHQWSYDLSGRLVGSRGAPVGFRQDQHSLLPIEVEAVAGCIYVALSADVPDFGPFRAVLEKALQPYNLSDVKVAHIATFYESGNWKLAMENARECHHCSATHPEFTTAVPVDDISATLSGSVELDRFTERLRSLGIESSSHVEEWWQVGRLPMREGYVSYSLDGKPLVKRPLSELGNGDLGSLRWAIEPNNFCHVTGDCVFMFNANPTSALTTTVTGKWLVHKDAVEGRDYDIERLIHVWNQTNRQDQKLVENNQRGVNGIGYRPGPYLPSGEPFVMRFVDWYCARARDYLSHVGTSEQ